MINVDLNYFSSNQKWIKNREKTFFKSIEEVNNYHKKKLKQIYFYHGIKKSPDPSPELPKSNGQKSIKILRSGTTSLNSEREYHYSLSEYEYVERHHIWKIEKLYNLEDKGDVIWIAPRDYVLVGDYDKKRIFGPKTYLSVGEQNKSYELFFNHNFTKKHWEYNLNLINDKRLFNIKFIRTCPSAIETIYYFFKDTIKIPYPVICSEESLSPRVREMAESIFTKVIDKMVCWDGCLGWFECPFGTKHIYDEFCFVKELHNNLLCVTDLNNFCTPFINYINGDKGKIGQINCRCGIAGNYFEQFEGKTIEAIYVENKNQVIPGRFISEKLSVFFRLGKEYQREEIAGVDFDKNFVYRIKQKENFDFEFQYDSENELSTIQKNKISLFLNNILWQNNKKIIFRKLPINNLIISQGRTKSLCIESEYIKKFKHSFHRA